MQLHVILIAVAILSVLVLASVLLAIRSKQQFDNQNKKQVSGDEIGIGMGVGIAIGMAIGVGIGIALEKISLGIAIGAPIGISLGILFGNILKENRKRNTGKVKFQPERDQRNTMLLLIVGGIAVFTGFLVLCIYFFMKVI